MNKKMQIYKRLSALILMISTPIFQGCEAIKLNVRSSFRMPSEDKNIQKTILELKIKKESATQQNLESKIDKYNRANSKVPNTVAQQDINDLETELLESKIESEIIMTQLEALDLSNPMNQDDN